MKGKKSFSRAGFLVGAAIAISSVLTGGGGAALFWKTLDKENRGYIQQAIGDNTLILAAHFRAQFESLTAHILEAGEAQIHANFKPVYPGPNSAEPKPPVGLIEADPDILDLSLWRMPDPSSTPNEPNLPNRVYVAINSKYPDGHPGFTEELEASKASEVQLIRQVFQGGIYIGASTTQMDRKWVGFIAIPSRQNPKEEVIAGHFNLEILQKAFIGNQIVSGFLVDEKGNILAKSGDGPFKVEKLATNPLFQAMKSSVMEHGQINFLDENGASFFGGYSRLNLGKLSVLATVPGEVATSSLQLLKREMIILLSSSFVLFFLLGYLLFAQGRLNFGKQKEVSVEQSVQPDKKGKEEQGVEITFQSIKSGSVTVLYGSLRQMKEILEGGNPVEAVETINDYFTIASSVVRELGGVFDRYSEKSFVGFWGAPAADGGEVWRALRCALMLRKEFYHYNEARKVDGRCLLSFGMGVHTGNGIAARLGPLKYQRYSIAGDVLNSAKALCQTTVSMRVDLLASQDSWQASEGKFKGDLIGEVKLTYDTGLKEVYSISGYRNEDGSMVEVEVPYDPVQFSADEAREGVSPEVIIPEKKVHKYLVNNGSQIIGPLTEHEIAMRLFAQELDFDCECWIEGVGKSEQIKSSGIFSGSDDEAATLWIFDGTTIHGPITAGFIKTAVGHGAIRDQVYICERSTIHGWKTLSEWDSTGVFAQNSTADESKSSEDKKTEDDPNLKAA